MNIIDIRNLSKSFGSIKAVQDVSFCVKEGELFAFLGPNGAGKSTTINMLCAQLPNDSGQIFVDGINLADNSTNIKRLIGVVFQGSGLDLQLTVKENLESRAALYGIYKEEFSKRLEELTKLLDFKELLNRKLKNLSGGQKRRIDIARALIHDPKILILDEPTTGLDPQTRKTIWNVITSLRKEKNMTVFLTTHYMEEAVEADYIVIIDGGKIIARGTPHDLKTTYSKDFITLYNVEEEKVQALNLEYEKMKDAFRISIDNTQEATSLIVSNPDLFIDYEITKGKMDDVFLNVTGKNLTGGEE